MRMVRYRGHGGIEDLAVVDAPAPEATAGHVVVRVRSSCINAGTLAALDGAPFKPVRDLAGEVVAVGVGVEGFKVGATVLGWSDDSAHAELARVVAAQLVSKPDALPWDVAGSLYVSPLAALASVRAVGARAGDVVVVSGAAGSVGLIAAQLARRAGATVLGLAREENAPWLETRGILPVVHGDGQEERLRRAATRIDAFIDCVGAGHVELALALGVAKDRINTIVDFAAAKQHGVTTKGTRDAGGAPALSEIVGLVVSGVLDIPIAATFPLARVQDAYRMVAGRGMRGKVVIRPQE